MIMAKRKHDGTWVKCDDGVESSFSGAYETTLEAEFQKHDTAAKDEHGNMPLVNAKFFNIDEAVTEHIKFTSALIRYRVGMGSVLKRPLYVAP